MRQLFALIDVWHNEMATDVRSSEQKHTERAIYRDCAVFPTHVVASA
jgi:hypothetical protein